MRTHPPHLIIVVATLLAACAFTGCMSTKSGAAHGYTLASTASDHREVTESLFASDQAVLSNEDIDTILNAKATLPGEARLAVLRVGDPDYWARDRAAVSPEFLTRLETCPRIWGAVSLPALLVPERKTVPYLREAAARYQAELLLVYQVRTDQDYRYRALHRDETKAYCTVEAVLLDVRTGIVPFSHAVMEEYYAKESSDDFGFSETIRKAEREALDEALTKLAEACVRFLNETP